VSERWNPPPLSRALLRGGWQCSTCAGLRRCTACDGGGLVDGKSCDACLGALWCTRCRGTGELDRRSGPADPLLYERRWYWPAGGAVLIAFALLVYQVIGEHERSGFPMETHWIIATLYAIGGRTFTLFALIVAGLGVGAARLERFSEPIRRRYRETREREELARRIERRARSY
jgi:hypothetical protein